MKEPIDQLTARLEVVEAVLGFDPLVECSGDPSVDGCTDETCPIRGNSLRRLGLLVKTVMDENEQIRAWAEELESRLSVPPGTWERVVQRTAIKRLERRLTDAERMQHDLKQAGIEQPDINTLVSNLQADLQVARAALDEHTS